MLVCFENLDPENNSSWVRTAPTVPPLPVIPDTTPSDLGTKINKTGYCLIIEMLNAEQENCLVWNFSPANKLIDDRIWK